MLRKKVIWVITHTRIKITSVYVCIRLIITARKRSLRKLCFHKRLSFCPRGWGGSAASGGLVCPPRGVGGWADPPFGYYGIRSTSGRYASYWNAFLFYVNFCCDTFLTARMKVRSFGFLTRRPVRSIGGKVVISFLQQRYPIVSWKKLHRVDLEAPRPV